MNKKDRVYNKVNKVVFFLIKKYIFSILCAFIVFHLFLQIVLNGLFIFLFRVHVFKNFYHFLHINITIYTTGFIVFLLSLMIILAMSFLCFIIHQFLVNFEKKFTHHHLQHHYEVIYSEEEEELEDVLNNWLDDDRKEFDLKEKKNLKKKRDEKNEKKKKLLLEEQKNYCKEIFTRETLLKHIKNKTKKNTHRDNFFFPSAIQKKKRERERET